MGLTSGAFIIVMVLAAVGSLAATVWLWPRVAGRRLRALAARVGLLAGCQVLVIVSFLTFINGYFGFFGSWSEVFGTQTATPQSHLAVSGTSGRAVQVTATDLGPALTGSVLPVQADGAIAAHPPGGPAGPKRPEPRATLPATGPPRPPLLKHRRHRRRPSLPPSGEAPIVAGGPPTEASAPPSGPAHRRHRAGVGPFAGLHPITGQVGPGRHRPVARRSPAKSPGLGGRGPQVNGEVLQISLHGQRTGISVAQDYVYLPPQYFQRAYAHTRFPVVLALTGYPNDTWSIIRRLALPATAARMAAAKKIKPAIYLMMNVSPALPRDTECTNIPAGLQAFSFFGTDVPQAMEQRFRVQRSRSGWAVMGYSTGGYCAAKLAMLDPGQYSAAVSMAGYYNALQDSTTGDLYGGSAAYRNENDLNWRLTHLPAPPVSVLVTSSRVGERSLPDTLTFLRLIRPPMHGYSLILPQGGHNYRTWSRQLPQSLEWLSQRLSPAVPALSPQHS
jgi:enterochelin esterase-like enzyme